MDFHVTEYEKFIDKVSDSTWQLTFKKLPPVKFWCSIKLSEKAKKILLTFPARDVCETRFSSRIQQKNKHTTIN